MNRIGLYIIVFLLILTLGVFFLKPFVAKFDLPVSGKITSPFGTRPAPVHGASTFHTGIDIATPINTPIKAKFAGKVIDIYTHESGGKSLIVEHSNGWRSGYAHLNGYGKYKVGDAFKYGDIIAYTGNTGKSTAPHLHYTLTNPEGVKVDPLKYIGKNLA